MASSMIHYIVSHLIADRLRVKNLNMFLIGAVLAPDTGKKDDGSYCMLHYMDIRNDIERKGFNWNTFVDEHKNEMNNDYYSGYCCHLVMDALWFHDVYDKHIRHLPAEIKNEKMQAVYRDYQRLNYLLMKEYNVHGDFISVGDVPDADIDKASLLSMSDNIGKQFQAPKCTTDELEILTWDIVVDYIEKAKELCVREITVAVNGCRGMDPMELFVAVNY